MRYVVLGGTGHVGSAVAKSLLDAGEPVTIVRHDNDEPLPSSLRRADVAIADAYDAAALQRAFGQGNRLYLLNPPGRTDGDFDTAERATIGAIVEAAAASAPEWAVVHSTYGAQPGKRCGDLTTLYGFERAMAATAVPHAVLRAAYYFTNWDLLLNAARTGTLPTMFPEDFVLPMVDPIDLGKAGAQLVRMPGYSRIVHFVEGPRRYTPGDAAAAFAAALDRPVMVAVTPPEDFEKAYREQGFSAESAASFACMMRTTLAAAGEFPEDYERGDITLEAHIRDLVAAD